MPKVGFAVRQRAQPHDLRDGIDGRARRDGVERLAQAGGLELEFRESAAVFWKRVDDAELRALEGVVKMVEPTPGRCEALRQLSQLPYASQSECACRQCHRR